jgi:hypothetical protein
VPVSGDFGSQGMALVISVHGLSDMQFQEAHELLFLTSCALGGFGETAARVSMILG